MSVDSSTTKMGRLTTASCGYCRSGSCDRGVPRGWAIWRVVGNGEWGPIGVGGGVTSSVGCADSFPSRGSPPSAEECGGYSAGRWEVCFLRKRLVGIAYERAGRRGSTAFGGRGPDGRRDVVSLRSHAFWWKRSLSTRWAGYAWPGSLLRRKRMSSLMIVFAEEPPPGGGSFMAEVSYEVGYTEIVRLGEMPRLALSPQPDYCSVPGALRFLSSSGTGWSCRCTGFAKRLRGAKHGTAVLPAHGPCSVTPGSRPSCLSATKTSNQRGGEDPSRQCLGMT
ncbi:hypothetical protein D2E23_2019 [Bifidobacterium callimiconis]|uniref:Uncharacterized protein n=1 Tax=Bifidobacterium callimiconis TaxID=2306973 RepID=A0A430F9L7_9BIFI|nr:hypothetical protein D2E23_2019 [Bifidobacterium callimiconis]